MTADRARHALEAERCRRDAHAFVFDARRLVTKDEHDAREPVKPVPDLLYLRALLDCYLVSGRLLAAGAARWAREAGVAAAFLEALWATGVLFVEKSRDMFVTNLTCCYLLWRARMAHQLILVQSKKEEDAAKLVFTKEPQFARLSFMEDRLPPWLRQLAWPKGGAYGNLYFPNGSHVRAIPEGGDIIRSEHPSVIVSDEAGFQPDFGAAYTAALPAVEGGGQFVAVSSATPSEFEAIVDAKNAQNERTAIPGLSWRLASGAIPVLRLHYAADPAKRPGTPAGEAWRARAAGRYAGGIASPRWKQEMEIEYGALSGTKLLPDWELWSQGPIVVDPFSPRGYRLYGSYDHGWTNPAAYHVHGINGDGDKVTLWEFYADRVPLSYIAKIIRGETVVVPPRPEATIEPGQRRFAGNPFAGEEVWKVGDPSMWAEDKPQQDAPNKSTARLFREAGVHFRAGQRGGDTTVAEWLLGVLWADPARPRYRIVTTCRWLLWELGQQRFKELSAQVAQHANPSETLVDKANHAWDGLKMFLQEFPPTPAERRPEQTGNTFAWWRQQLKREREGLPVQTFRVGQREMIG